MYLLKICLTPIAEVPSRARRHSYMYLVTVRSRVYSYSSLFRNKKSKTGVESHIFLPISKFVAFLKSNMNFIISSNLWGNVVIILKFQWFK